MHQMDLEYEHGCTNNTAIWKRGVKVYSLLVRVGLRVRLASAWPSDGELLISPGSGRRAGVEHANNRSSVERRGWEPRDHQPTRPSERHKLRPTMQRWIQHIINAENAESLPCEIAGMRACVSMRWWAFVYSDCDGGCGGCLPVWDSEQRAGGLGMEQRICIDCFCASELFSRCQSCLHQLRGKLQHLHREAFSFLSFYFFSQMYLFNSFYFTKGDVSTSSHVREWSRCVQTAFWQIYRQNLNSEKPLLSRLVQSFTGRVCPFLRHFPFYFYVF